ncbi:GyrI-like domain-containing protein [Deinococcus roseus]|uniref:AraC effector-binding domain-containing protein n=1 Tax=Deinococcus roseus TaxID=392414 RepID=A0ABQ2D1B4_9DEIO|nr:GyrI-like domain-containing protein [Deinococcus roseus]GGJ36753.1 hypothetical protein GCM10008938_23520 [Deinococcus roseus]
MSETPPETPVLVQLQQQPTLSIHRKIPIADISTSHGECFQLLHDHLKAQQIVAAGPPFVRYHTFEKEHTDVEVGVPLQQDAPASAEIQAGHLPEGPALVTEHVGPHQKLGEAYRRLHQAMKSSSHEPEGAIWEIYHWMDLTKDPAEESTNTPQDWHTTLVQPLKKQ